MEFLAQVFEIFLWVVFILWGLRKLAGWVQRSNARPPVERQQPAPVKTLHQDPQCGTYVAEDISCRLEEGGKTLHFCSEECRMRYVARQNRAARA